jgi:Flp pilus assembly protein TadB
VVSEYHENKDMITLQMSLWALCGAVVITCFARLVLGHKQPRALFDVARANSQTKFTVEEVCGARNLSDSPSVQRELEIAVPDELASPDDKLRILLFRAGIFSAERQMLYRRWRYLSPITLSCLFVGVAFVAGLANFWLLLCVGGLIGIQVPRSYLQRRAQQRDEEILFYLPLVIEQVVLGVSSSLDVAPCIKWIVEIADERDSHNAVTELLALVLQYMKLGIATDESLCEVAKLSGHTELKHVFMSLAHLVRHGGEVTKQLQELANAVASQREVKIEALIKSLEIKATGPVGMIFASFMGMFLASLGLQMMSSFK